MTDRLQLWVCENYRQEVKIILQGKLWDDIDLRLIPQVCQSPAIHNEVLEKFEQVKPAQINNYLMLGSCQWGTNKRMAELSPSRAYCMDQCFYMLLNRSLVDHLTNQGAYVISPGWLDKWRANLQRWGFDQSTAREFFHETIQRLVLLDTGINPLSTDQLQELSEYLNLPSMIYPVGLDYLELYLTQIVYERKREQAEHRSNALKAHANRQAADNAMALDLLTQLTHVLVEEEAIREIMDLFSMLFSPGMIVYFSVNNQELGKQFGQTLDEKAFQELSEWVLQQDDEYIWKDSGKGFAIRLGHQGQTVGVLQMEDFPLPEYSKQYLNLSLTIAHLCGLAITNTRIYQKLQEAEAHTRREKEVSETLRMIMSELTSQLDLQPVLDQIFESLFKVIPYSNAAIFLRNDDHQLNFQTGMQVGDDGLIAPFIPQNLQFELDVFQFQDGPLVLTFLDDHPQIRKFVGAENIGGWLGLPLALRGEVIGFLSISRGQNQVFIDDEISIAQSFASEVTIAIGNARMYENILDARNSLEKRVKERTAELQTANVALEKAGRMKDEFLASVSHELRTPLVGILGLSEVLQLETYGPLSEKQLKAMATIAESGKRLLKLINDILDYSKLEAGMVELQVSAYSLEALCTSCLKEVKKLEMAKHLQSSFTISPETIIMKADVRRLKQILHNLLSNAIKFTPDGGKYGIDVIGKPDEKQVQISVWDTGIGIGSENLTQLFQPFVQLDGRLARQYEGTGLGLMLVHKLVELHGGYVQVQSVFGAGSRFSINLPWDSEAG